MTNPDNVGWLPELPKAAHRFQDPEGDQPDILVYTADQMRAYGELCRAAPAGGDDFAERLWEALSPDDCPKLTRRKLKAALKAANSGNSAPAGSGEVEKQARALYVRWVDQQDMHCNRFPSWQELSAKDRQEWFDKVVAADTGNAAVDRVIGRLMSSDPDFDDCAEAAALLRKLQQGAE